MGLQRDLLLTGAAMATLAFVNVQPACADTSPGQPNAVQIGANATPPLTRQQRAAARKAAREARQAERRRQKAVRAARARGADSATYQGADGADIVVVGLRESVAKSVERKRKARQIVDVVTAEDAGKLPDNNVIEAMSRITGITVTRSGGRADGFTIRGLDGIQTTVNGNDAASAGGRTLNLASVPADLIKSVEVYKTRTADQIEGGIGGSVNIELRRPLDLPKGWTAAGGIRGQYNEIGGRWSPFLSGLVSNRFDTGIGEMGILINAAYSKPKYDEAYNNTESPDLLGYSGSPIRNSLPAAQRDTLVAPFAATFGANSGERTQTSVSASAQWRPSSQLNFVLEGSYFGETYRNSFNYLYARTRSDYYTIQNPRIAPSGVLLGYDVAVLRDANGNLPNFGRAEVFGGGGQSRGRSENYRVNFETHWEAPGVRIDASAQYNWSNFRDNLRSYGNLFDGLTGFRVDFDSPNVLGNGPYIDFGAVDPTNPATAKITSLSDNIGFGDNTSFSAQADVWKHISDTGLFRSAKFGARYSRFTFYNGSSYRFAGWFDPARVLPLTVVPGVETQIIQPEIPGGQSISWIGLNAGQLFDAWDAARQIIRTGNPEVLDGPGRDTGAAAHFADATPSAEDAVYTGLGVENVFAAYLTTDFAFKALVPFDGNVGVRYVNTYNTITGNNLRLGPAITDPVTGLAIPGQFGPDTFEQVSLRGNQADLLPSAFLKAQLARNLLLRGSYSYNVQRPGLFELRNYRNVNFRDVNATVYAGNPKLKPVETTDYNLALEWYFGRGGLVSVTGFWKNQTGFIYFTRLREQIPELNNEIRFVEMPRNAGPGKTQGVEFQATGFFTFLPGFLRNLGATANATWIPTAEVSLPREADGQPGVYNLIPTDSPFTSRFSYNLIGYYETPAFGVRVAYNRRSKFKNSADAFGENWVISTRPTQRLDAAITYTPFKFLTLSVEGQNLLGDIDMAYYYRFPELANGIRAMSRTVVLGARARF